MGPQTYILVINKNLNLKKKIISTMSFLLFLRLIVYRQGRLPVKWTAYEALMFNTYTTKSDVWVNRSRLEIQFMMLKIFE